MEIIMLHASGVRYVQPIQYNNSEINVASQLRMKNIMNF